MSHTIGTVPTVTPHFEIGPDTGDAASFGTTWEKGLVHQPAPTGTKFVILHFLNVDLPAGNRLEVDLGYDTDVFTSGGQFWTRPINVAAVGGGTAIPIRYVADAANNGAAFVDRYARGESLQDHEFAHDSITNCDPFLVDGTWQEPDFPHIPGSTDPKYDPFWICDENSQPRWQNADCAVAGQVWANVARSVGMILSVHQGDAGHPHESVGSCTVTLIDSDLVVLAGHCVADHAFEVPTSSVTFDFEVDCFGNAQPAYDAHFYKVKQLVKYRYVPNTNWDYAIVQLDGNPPLPPIPVAGANPAIGDAVFGVHHPNGAVKKIGPSAGATVPVSSSGFMIGADLDVAGGSSGSGLFNASGEIVGVLARGAGGCNDLFYSSTDVMLNDPITIPDPPAQRRAMIVLDRSGSMSGTAGDGKVKIDEARDAAELFTSLMREDMGNEAGLVSFATSAGPPEESLGALDNAKKVAIIGDLPGITPGGSTSIGKGLEIARGEFALPGDPPRSILLLTDGMENTGPLIADVTGLDGIDVTAIGFGTEANLDGARLAELAHRHNGFYKRAGSGLELKKFFALAFGDIFEAGALADPEHHLPATARSGDWVPFAVCEEEAVTVVLGWDAESADVGLEVRLPSGQILDLAGAGIDTQAGTTWQFARISLPHEGEREGTWHARIRRTAQGSSEFPPPGLPLNYFINVIARGGPRLRPVDQTRRLYTGDVLNPLVTLQYPDETVVRSAAVQISITRPTTGIGTVLAQNGLGSATVVAGDTIPAKQSTLAAIEAATGQLVTGHVASHHQLDTTTANTGLFMPSGVFGHQLAEVLVVDGTYTFHARAQFGLECTATRETQWSQHVAVGIDPGRTDVDATQIPGADGDRFSVTVTPKDRYGNHLGPGEGGELDVDPLPGCRLDGELVDNGDGSYTQVVDCEGDGTPGISVGQPGRDPVDLVPDRVPPRRRYIYTVNLVCGTEADSCCGCGPVGSGDYTTAITIANTGDRAIPVTRYVIPTTVSGAAAGRWPDVARAGRRERIVLDPHAATTIDCCSISELLLGAPSSAPQPLTMGVAVIEAPTPVAVTATYTVGLDGTQSIDVENVEPMVRESARPVRVARHAAEPEGVPTLADDDLHSHEATPHRPKGN